MRPTYLLHSLSLLVLSLLAVSVLVGLTACAPSPYGKSLGEECELNSDCDAPLVCRLAFCRRECSTSRDCGAGLDCVEDNSGLGGCQLPAETNCTNNSDCPAPLVCTMGECGNSCGSCTVPGPCRDCPAGADCALDADGELGCVDPSTRSCIYSSECGANATEFVCAADGRCRLECRNDCDCRFGEACRAVPFEENGAMIMGSLCVVPTPPDRSACLPDGGVVVDAGVADGGVLVDVGVADGGATDGP